MSQAVLRRASASLPAPLGTLDAIHLATAMTWMEHNNGKLILLTHDRQLAQCARAGGVQVLAG